MTADDPLDGWIPLYIKGARAEVEWVYMGSKRFAEPFCHDTLQQLASLPFNQFFRKKSSLSYLIERLHSHPGLPLRGIIFHMSRCGSTLAARYLEALPDSVVLSEPEPVETVLQWTQPDGDEIALRALLSAMGQPRRDCDRQLFLKADCVQMLHIDRLLAAFPNTPWVFLYRDPVEVLVSHERNPGWTQAMSFLLSQGMQPPDEAGTEHSSSCAWILSLVLRKAEQAMRDHCNGLLLNYSHLPQALDAMARHFGIDSDALDPGIFDAVRQHHSKRRDDIFQPDADEKRAAADPRLLALAARWLAEPYQALEQLRLNGSTNL